MIQLNLWFGLYLIVMFLNFYAVTVPLTDVEFCVLLDDDPNLIPRGTTVATRTIKMMAQITSMHIIFYLTNNS